MSVDQRIRQAFADLEAPTVPEVNAAMDRVLLAERRGRVRRRAALASGVAAAVATGAVLWGLQGFDGPDSPAPAPPAPNPSASSQGPLAGRWSTEPLTRSTVRAHLSSLGFGRYADRVVAELPPRRFRLRLYVASAGEWVLWAWGPGHKEVYYDRAVPTTDGDRLFLDPFGSSFDGGTTYKMVRSDTTLRLRYIGTDEPVTDGVPGAAWQQAFYTVAPFDRD
jgi:hypothetical protein